MVIAFVIPVIIAAVLIFLKTRKWAKKAKTWLALLMAVGVIAMIFLPPFVNFKLLSSRMESNPTPTTAVTGEVEMMFGAPIAMGFVFSIFLASAVSSSKAREKKEEEEEGEEEE